MPAPKSPSAVDHFVFINLGGGYDSVYTTDPKTKKELAPGVDLPFRSNEIIGSAFPMGPLMRPMTDWATRMTVLKGINVGTVSHTNGWTQFYRMKINAANYSPTIVDLLGRADSGNDRLSSMFLGVFQKDAYTSGMLGIPREIIAVGFVDYKAGANEILEYIETFTSEELILVGKTLRHRANDRSRSVPQRTLDLELQMASFLEKVASSPRFKTLRWSDVAEQQDLSYYLQRATWLLQNNMTKSVMIQFGMAEWDTHFDNARGQIEWNGHFFPMLSKFLNGLSESGLLSRTCVVVGSELGRYPYLNPVLGKDHFPVVAYMFFGGHLAGGKVFGSTGREMEALPISHATGLPTKQSGGFVPQLDDVGATVLSWAGLHPELYGYDGRRMRFLENGHA
jgi:hypothetical protein